MQLLVARGRYARCSTLFYCRLRSRSWPRPTDEGPIRREASIVARRSARERRWWPACDREWAPHPGVEPGEHGLEDQAGRPARGAEAEGRGHDPLTRRCTPLSRRVAGHPAFTFRGGGLGSRTPISKIASASDGAPATRRKPSRCPDALPARGGIPRGAASCSGPHRGGSEGGGVDPQTDLPSHPLSRRRRLLAGSPSITPRARRSSRSSCARTSASSPASPS